MKNHLPENIKQIVEPYLAKAFNWVNTGIQSYVNNDSVRNTIFEKRTRCNMVRDYIKHEVIKGKGDDKHLQVVSKGNTFLFVIDQKVAFKIKKLNANKMSVGRPTAQMELYRNGQMEFPGLLERPACLDIGYVPDEFWSGHNGIFISCHAEKWYFELSDATDIVKLPVAEINEVKQRTKRTKIKESVIVRMNDAKEV